MKIYTASTFTSFFDIFISIQFFFYIFIFSEKKKERKKNDNLFMRWISGGIWNSFNLNINDIIRAD